MNHHDFTLTKELAICFAFAAAATAVASAATTLGGIILGNTTGEERYDQFAGQDGAQLGALAGAFSSTPTIAFRLGVAMIDSCLGAEGELVSSFSNSRASQNSNGLFSLALMAAMIYAASQSLDYDKDDALSAMADYATGSLPVAGMLSCFALCCVVPCVAYCMKGSNPSTYGINPPSVSRAASTKQQHPQIEGDEYKTPEQANRQSFFNRQGDTGDDVDSQNRSSVPTMGTRPEDLD